MFIQLSNLLLLSKLLNGKYEVESLQVPSYRILHRKTVFQIKRPKQKTAEDNFYHICRLANVTASSGTAKSTNFATSTCSENFVKNSFKFDVALKHAQDEVPARKAPQKKQKSSLATNKHRRRLKRRPQRIQNTVLCQSLGGIHYYSKGNQCSRCSPEYPCGILCGN